MARDKPAAKKIKVARRKRKVANNESINASIENLSRDWSYSDWITAEYARDITKTLSHNNIRSRMLCVLYECIQSIQLRFINKNVWITPSILY